MAPGEESAELLPHCDKILLKGEDLPVDQDFSDGCHVDLYGDGNVPAGVLAWSVEKETEAQRRQVDLSRVTQLVSGTRIITCPLRLFSAGWWNGMAPFNSLLLGLLPFS